MRSLKDEIVGLKEDRTDLQGALKERTIAFAVASGLALFGMFLGIQKLLRIIGAWPRLRRFFECRRFVLPDGDVLRNTQLRVEALSPIIAMG